MQRPTFILDSAIFNMEIADLKLQAAVCMDAATRRVLGTAVSASRDDAMVTAFGNAVFAAGVPAVVQIDNAVDVPDLVRECWLLGIEIAHGPSFQEDVR